MLVLSTMFISVSNGLPKTSYMKMVDVWLLFNLFYPFLVVLLHTYMDTLRNEEDASNSEKQTTQSIQDRKVRRLRFMKKVALVYMPVSCLIFAGIYWIIELRQSEAF